MLLPELDAFIRLGKLEPRQVITTKHMYDAGLLERRAYRRNGVVLLNKRVSAQRAARYEAKLGYPLPDVFQVPVEVEVRAPFPSIPVHCSD